MSVCHHSAMTLLIPKLDSAEELQPLDKRGHAGVSVAFVVRRKLGCPTGFHTGSFLLQDDGYVLSVGDVVDQK